MRALALVIVLAACGGKSSTPPPQEPEKREPLTAEQHAAAVEDISTRGCACADAACIGAVDAELAEIIGDLAVDVPESPDAAVAEVLGGYLECASKLVAVDQLASYKAFGARLDDVAAAACACKDLACTERAFGDLLPELVAFAIHFQGDPTAMPALEAQMKQVEECIKPFHDQVANQAIEELTVLRDAACACKDSACAAKVNADFEVFLQKHENTKGDQAQAETIGRIAGEMSECMQPLMGTPAP